MRIAVVSAVGEGGTLLSSFDDALWRCGVGNYNLLVLSSVIPPGSRIETCRPHRPCEDEHGHKLYVVKAESRAAVPGQAVAAGIAWYQWGDGRGVFVEHEAHGDDERCVAAEVDRLLHTSLRDLCATRRIAFAEVCHGDQGYQHNGTRAAGDRPRSRRIPGRKLGIVAVGGSVCHSISGPGATFPTCA